MKKIICAVAIMGAAAGAWGQNNLASFGFAPRWTNLLSGGALAIVSNGVPSVVTVNSPPFPVYRDRGFSFWPLFAGTNSTVTNIGFAWDFTLDGTNWTTTHPLTNWSKFNGTNAVGDYFFNGPASWDDIKQARLAQIIVGHTNTVWVTNLGVGSIP